MSMTPSPEPDWRERKKERTRASLREHSLRLFNEKGFEATTVEEIAAAAGVSHMTFFRYFPTKEDSALSDDYDPMIAELIAERPSHESAAEKIRHALTAGLARMSAQDRAALLTRMRLVLKTPALQAGTWERQNADRQRVIDALSRSTGSAEDTLRTRVTVAASLAAASEAIRFWAENDGRPDLAQLVDQALSSLRDAPNPH